MKGVTIIALTGICPAAFGQLWDQSALVNMADGGTGGIAGEDLCMLEANENTLGFNANTAEGSILADDFTVGLGGWHIQRLTFWAYQTGENTPTISGVNFAIDSDLTSSVLTAAANVQTVMSDIHRVVQGDTASWTVRRQLQKIEVTGLDIHLDEGSYWLKFNFEGIPQGSGPWQPHLPGSLAAYGNNAVAWNGSAFVPIYSDTGVSVPSIGADLPFQIHSDAVPEPTALGLMALGGVTLFSKRRRIAS